MKRAKSFVGGLVFGYSLAAVAANPVPEALVVAGILSGLLCALEGVA